MDELAKTCEQIAATTRKSKKLSILAEYLRSRPRADAAISALFLSGRAFPAFQERTLQVGGALLWKAVSELTDASGDELRVAYRKHGDLGSAACELLAAHDTAGPAGAVALAEVANAFDDIAAARSAAAKAALLKALLLRSSPLASKYILKIVSGELRIGLKESLVEEAIAKAYDEPFAKVQRANMLLGDIAATLEHAAEHRLDEVRMRLFHPIGFMLASPAASAGEAFEYFEHAQVEDKYDGIRAQAHISDGRARLFSRTLDEVSESFPELLATLSSIPCDAIFDGEIIAWQHAEESGHAMPFSALQQRLGRKQVSDKLRAAVPVAYVVFDVLFADDSLLLDHPLTARIEVLNRILPYDSRLTPKPLESEQRSLRFDAEPQKDAHSGWVLRAPARRADSAEQLEAHFEQAMARGNEGLMIKDLHSPYMPGRRGRWWLKLKRELATLDVVVTAVEYGHGKRIAVLSDYTFAVRRGEELLNIGKAYSGLTDAEIAEMTRWFLAHTTADQGFLREVEPEIVLEVAFNAIMRSDRHDSGFALRFPRILRIRRDKSPAEINTLDDVEAIYARQHGQGRAREH
ncbi:MAG TPA: ATP-dependent DNA ligase [Candidatus Eisenbacteria bacterium]|nr:ATP-dependent DNA ligase [Candidatus Eisenbacteria bacterium]